jgi:hypothetical protein
LVFSHSRLSPPSIEAAPPLRDDALSADLAHGLEQLFADAQEVIDIDDPRAPCRADHIAQQHLPVLDRAAPEVVAVEMQEIESELGEPLRPPLTYGIAQGVEMRHAATVRDGNLAIQHHWRQPQRSKLDCGWAAWAL